MAIQPNRLEDPTLHIKVSQVVGIGSPELLKQSTKSQGALDSCENNGEEGGWAEEGNECQAPREAPNSHTKSEVRDS